MRRFALRLGEALLWEQGKGEGFCVLLRIRWAGRAAAKAGTEHSPAEGHVPHLCFGGTTAAFGPQGTMQTNSGALCSQAPQSFPGPGTWSSSWVQLCLSSSRRSVLPGGRHRSNRSTGELCLSLVSRELRVTGVLPTLSYRWQEAFLPGKPRRMELFEPCAWTSWARWMSLGGG